jgi:pimeloyl-ACP methyl ester carboxylesterase
VGRLRVDGRSGSYPRRVDTPHPTSDLLPSGQSNLDDWRGLGDVIAITTNRLATPVEGMHRAIVDRWFGLVGLGSGEPVRILHDHLAESTYKAIRVSGSALGAGIAVGADVASRRRPLRPLWNTPKGSYVQSIFNALWGDKFEEDQSAFRIELGLRDGDGEPIPTAPSSLRLAFPEPKSRLVVLLHGLGETEQCWVRNGNTSLAKRLEADGFSVLLVRYNSGRPVADNGIDLAILLDAIVRKWPVPVDDVSLVGHSMGGLVAHSAVATAHADRHAWVTLTNHLVAVGTPHFGTPIEKAVHLASEGLELVGETRPLGRFIGQRSAGIKDLRFGPDGAAHQIGGIEHHFVAGAVTNEPGHPASVLLGDLVVRTSSATARGRQRRTRATDIVVMGGRNHGALVHDVEVHSKIRTWLADGQSPVHH